MTPGTSTPAYPAFGEGVTTVPPSPTVPRRCRVCGAPRDGKSDVCWFCGAPRPPRRVTHVYPADGVF